jgi:DNA replication and repair protein RecF
MELEKLTFLDSIHYLSFCKSFLNPSDRQNIKTGEDFFVIKGEV